MVIVSSGAHASHWLFPKVACLIQRDVLLRDSSWAVVSPWLVHLFSLLRSCAIFFGISTLRSERMCLWVHWSLRWPNLESLGNWQDILNVHQVLIEV